jgi:hypothetical protein
MQQSLTFSMTTQYIDHRSPDEQLKDGIDRLDFDLVQKALKLGANPNEHHKLFSIDAKDRARFVMALLENGHDPNASPGFPDMPLSSSFMRCMMRGDQVTARLIMAHSRVKVDLLRKDNHGWTPPFAAVCNKNVPPEFLQELQSYFEREMWPAQPHLARNQIWTERANDGTTPMMAASSSPELLRWLLSQPHLGMVDALEVRCNEGKTALWYAAEGKNSAAVRVLLEFGAKVKTHDHHGRQMIDHLRSTQPLRTLPVDAAAQATMELLEAHLAVENAMLAMQSIVPPGTKGLRA